MPLNPKLFLPGLVVLLYLLSCPPVFCAPLPDLPAPSLWVWNRSSPLDRVELELLKTAGVRVLYWNVGTITQGNPDWSWRSPALDRKKIAAEGVEIVPVLRLNLSGGNPFSPPAQTQLLSLIQLWIQNQGIQKLQLDCDCPDQYLADYSSFCRNLKSECHLSTLEITALASWGSQMEKLFTNSIDGVSPMFYDLNPARETLQNGNPAPLLDEASTRKNLALWSHCSIPWQAGLPYFSRVTLFDKNGRSQGHLRNVWPDDIVYNSSLKPLSFLPDGSFLMSATRDGSIGSTPFLSGSTLSFRFPDLKALARLAGEAVEKGAKKAIYFSLPDNGRKGTQSLFPLLSGSPASSLRLERSDSGAYLLTNTGSSDLLPSISPDIRGYELIIQSPVPIWKEVLPGDFYSLRFSSSQDSQATKIPAVLANELHLYFSHLPAGGQLSTGLTRYRTGQNREPVQYQLITPEQCGPWSKLP